MNDLRKTTITTLEVAEMMETEHWKLLRKLDGRTKGGEHERGYVEILTHNHLVVSDYFIPSTIIQGRKVKTIVNNFLMAKITY